MTATTPGLQPAARRMDLTGALILIALCAVWGGNTPAVKIANEGITPVFQAGLRSIGSGVLLILWCWVRGIRLFKLDGSLPLGLLIGCLFSLEFGLLYTGLSKTDASRAVLYIFTSPFVTALGAHFFMPGERLTPLKWLGLILAFAAVAIVFSSGLTVPKREQIVGDLLCLAMGFTWGVENVIVKVSRLRHVEVERILFYDLTVSAVVLTGAALLIGEAGVFNPSLRVMLSLGYAVVAISFVSYLVFTSMLRRYQAAGLASFMFLSPIFGVALSSLMLGEALTSTILIALGLNALGIILVNRPGR
ncbi:MAG: DMT family transporter [Hyphomicrobiaceae bacterium]